MIFIAVIPSSILNKPNISVKIDWEINNLADYSFVNAIKRELVENNQSEYCYGTARMTIYNQQNQIVHQFVPTSIKPFEPPYEAHNPSDSVELTNIKKATKNLNHIIDKIVKSISEKNVTAPDETLVRIKEIKLSNETVKKARLEKIKKMEEELEAIKLEKNTVNIENIMLERDQELTKQLKKEEIYENVLAQINLFSKDIQEMIQKVDNAKIIIQTMKEEITLSKKIIQEIDDYIQELKED